MIIKANKQIGFIYKNNESIDKILKDGDVVFERGFLREKTSTTLPITFGGVGKDLKDYRVYGNTVQSKLPDGYTQVDYIESSGTQYIDTGFKPNQDTSVDIDIEITQLTNLNQSPFGARTTSTSNNYSVMIGGTAHDTFYNGWDGNAYATENLAVVGQKYNIYKNKNLLYLNGNLINERTYTNFAPNLNMFLLSINQNGNVTFFVRAKLFSCKIYDDTTLVRDFIPCYRNNDNEIGLYDLVNNVFYTNQGTDTFTYGNVAPTPDTPIEIVSCGDRTKNIIPQKKTLWESGHYGINGNKTNYDSRMRLIDLFPVQPNTEYYVYGKTFIIREYDNSQNFINNIGIVYSKNTFITNQNTMFLGIAVDTVYDNYDETTSKIMICTNDNVDKSYEPYGYKIPANVRSENLISQTIYQTNTNLNDNGEMVSNNNYFVMKQTNIKPLSKYILSENQVVEMTGTNTTPIRVCAYDKNDNLISLVLKNVRTEVKRYNDEFTIPENTEYILISFRNTDSNIELVESIDTNIYLDEPLRKIDEYSDYIDFANQKVVRRIKEVLLSSENNWASASNTRPVFSLSTFTDKLDGRDNFICSHFKYLGNTQQTDLGFAMSFNSGQYYRYLYIQVPSSIAGIAEVSNFKTWFGTIEPITLDYPLATPIEETITLPNIPTIDGNNTLNIETKITPSKVYIKYKSNE